ncbi:hypothetical protein BV22DRAFT_607137 [Leucogyrophana mollusca]|uniref:Uncharacterized protein n=1 Tax=Leucogyrophana mollusca TaxID=85980 RepID=A0ACB8BBQ5_9AGAM|nr:hypothetical protein BV22DRAFT_607137 [Leucogyrophana mollusca]
MSLARVWRGCGGVAYDGPVLEWGVLGDGGSAEECGEGEEFVGSARGEGGRGILRRATRALGGWIARRGGVGVFTLYSHACVCLRLGGKAAAPREMMNSHEVVLRGSVGSWCRREGVCKSVWWNNELVDHSQLRSAATRLFCVGAAARTSRTTVMSMAGDGGEPDDEADVIADNADFPPDTTPAPAHLVVISSDTDASWSEPFQTPTGRATPNSWVDIAPPQGLSPRRIQSW